MHHHFGGGESAVPHGHKEMDVEEEMKDLYSNVDALLEGGGPHRVPAKNIARAATILPSQGIFPSKIRRESSDLKQLSALAKSTRPATRVGGVALPRRITGKATDVQVAQSMMKKRMGRGRNRIHLRSQTMGSVPFSRQFSRVADATTAATTTGMASMADLPSSLPRFGAPPVRAVVYTDGKDGSGAVVAPPQRQQVSGLSRIHRYQTAPAKAFAGYINPFDDLAMAAAVSPYAGAGYPGDDADTSGASAGASR